MSLSSFSNFEGPDIAAFLACAALGFFAGTLAPEGSGASLYVTVLVAYHLFLAWLVFLSNTSFSEEGDSRKDAAMALPVVHTLLTHAACLAVILGSVASAVHKLAQLHADPQDLGAPHSDGYAIYQIAKVVCGAMAGLAIFERRWLFSAEPAMRTAHPTLQTAPLSPVLEAATGDDMRDWQHYLAQKKPGSRPLGSSIKAEYEQWLMARQQARNAAAPES